MLPQEILYIIGSFVVPKRYRIRQWIDQSKLWMSEVISMRPDIFDEAIITKEDPLLFDYEFCATSNNIQFLRKHLNKVNWNALLTNPYATSLIEEKIEEGTMNEDNWKALCKNPRTELIEKHLEYANWHILSLNPKAIHILQKNEEKISSRFISQNPSALHLLPNNFDDIDFYGLSSNPNPNVYPLLIQSPNDIIWKNIAKQQNIKLLSLFLEFPEYPLSEIQSFQNSKLDISMNLSFNENAIFILETYPEYVDWYALSFNKNALPILLSNFDKIDWCNFSKNPNAIVFLEMFQNRIDYFNLSKNTNIFELDLDTYKSDLQRFVLNIYVI